MLKPYVAYSRYGSPSEGAILVIANTVQEARKLAWGFCWNVDEWIDQAATLIDRRHLSMADTIKLQANEPHVIENPPHCISCLEWEHGITTDRLCCNCNEFPGEKVLKCYGSTISQRLKAQKTTD